ncbi:MAG: leucine-rich repeat protein [Clostridia bacterium]|nr:leucine-rich repeat protein [Clostridia bacterium]
MKKILSLTLVVLMLLCIVPMNIFAGDTIVEGLPGYHTRYAEFHIIQNGGYYNANSGEAITNGGFYTAANGLNIPNGYTGNIVVYVYQGTNAPADQVMNHYVGVVYTDQGTKSDSFYPLGDLMAVIYRSMVKDGNTLTDLTWMNFGASWYADAFLTVAIPAAVFADVGAMHGFSANWVAEEVTCVDHVFGADAICTVCGEAMQLTYVVGDYTYKVIGSDDVPVDVHGLGVVGGWAVYATDKTKTSYGEIRNTLHGFPVTLMYKTFDGCSNMTVAPAIPANVQVAYNAYKGTAITSTPNMGNVEKLYGTFKNCKNLTNVGTIPATVTDMTGAFSGCTALTKAPAIPASVTNMTQTFRNCTKLKAAPDITNVAIITEAFDGCTALSGSVSFNSNYNAKAFRNTSVSSATIGASKIERSCFNNSYLKNVTYTGTAAQWLSLDVASGNAALKSANVVTSTVASAPSVTVKDGRTYICDIDGADVKDVFIAKGTQNAYKGVKDNTVVRFTASKIGGSNIIAYGVALASGNYTLYVRNIDGTVQNVTFTVA